MLRLHSFRVALVVSLLCAGPAVAAVDGPTLVMPPYQTSLTFPAATLVAPCSGGGGVLGYGQPLHGTLTRLANVAGQPFAFTPTLDFWSLGLDGFDYQSFDGFSLVTCHARLVPQRLEEAEREGFEGGLFGDWFGVLRGAQIEATTDSAIGGAWGLRVDPVKGMTLGQPPNIGGGGSQGGSTGVTIRVPPRGIVATETDQQIADFGDVATPHAGLRLRSDPNDAWLSLVFGRDESAAVPLPVGVHRIEVDSWSGGLRLRVDRRARTTLAAPGFAPGLKFSIGARPWFANSAVLPLDMDDLELRWRLYGSQEVEWATTPGARVDFEEPEAPPEFDVSQAGEAAVLPSAALAGQLGLSVPYDAGSEGKGAGSWLDSTAAQARVFNVRLLVRADASVDGAAPFVGAYTDNGGSTLPVLGLDFVRQGGQQQLVAFARQDDGTRVELPLALGAGSHRVELQWRAGSGPAGGDGLLRVWLDGALAAETTEIDNDGVRLEAVRLGLVGPVSGVGSLALDDFETWW